MTHVVAESCILCKYTGCMTVCPMDGFHMWRRRTGFLLNVNRSSG